MRAQGYVTASFLQNGNVGPFAGLYQGFDRVFDASARGQSTTEEELAGASLGPSLATLVTKALAGSRWVHEIKFGGYRLQAVHPGHQEPVRLAGGGPDVGPAGAERALACSRAAACRDVCALVTSVVPLRPLGEIQA